MKTFRLAGLAAFAIILFANFFACSSDPIVPEVTVEMGKEDYFAKNMDFDSSAGEKTFSFNSNVEWTISVAPTMNGETWCTVTPISGKEGNSTIVVKVQENTGYDDRNVVLTLTAGSTLTKTITVTQKQKDAILLTTNKFEIEPQGGKINIEVKANVDYEAIISESCKSWISLASKSRGLTTSNITFDIAETEEYDKREGEIIIKSGELSETIHIYQAGQEILLLTKNEYPVSNKGETIVVEIKSNFTFDVQMPNVDWVVDESKSRGVSSHSLYYTILPNETYDSREAEIIFYDKNSSIKDTLKIIQKQNDAILLSQKEHNIEAEGGEFEIQLKTNIDYKIEINSSWIEKINITSSRALSEHTLRFKVDKNNTEKERSAKILISDKENNINETLLVNQKALQPSINFSNGTLQIKTIKQNQIKELCKKENITYEYIEKIIVSGPIGNDDFSFINALSSAYSLSYIDLTEAICKLPSYAFQGCTKIETFIYPKNVYETGWYFLCECLNVENIIFPKDSEYTIFRTGSFRECSNLKQITIPETVTEVQHQCFYLCHKLEKIQIKATTPPSCKEDAFGNGKQFYEKVKIYVPKGTLNDYKVASGWCLFTNIQEE